MGGPAILLEGHLSAHPSASQPTKTTYPPAHPPPTSAHTYTHAHRNICTVVAAAAAALYVESGKSRRET